MLGAFPLLLAACSLSQEAFIDRYGEQTCAWLETCTDASQDRGDCLAEQAEGLDALIGERLLDAEARRRGLTRDTLLEREVEAKVQRPSAAEVDLDVEARVRQVTTVEADLRREGFEVAGQVFRHVFADEFKLRRGGVCPPLGGENKPGQA